MDVAFTDSSLDLQGLGASFPQDLAALEGACGTRFARMNQVHGDGVILVDRDPGGPAEHVETGDALITAEVGVGLMVRVADCVPILLADLTHGVVGAVHAGRAGLAAGVVPAAVRSMRALGAEDLLAWIGPHVCGGCYEVPDAMRDEVSRSVPQAWATTRAGTASLDLGAGVAAQLAQSAIEVHHVGGCTLEDRRLHSYRRDGVASGRLAGVVWLT